MSDHRNDVNLLLIKINNKYMAIISKFSYLMFIPLLIFVEQVVSIVRQVVDI